MLSVVVWAVVALAAAYFASIAWVTLRAARELDQLRDSAAPGLTRCPRLSLIIPARDEAGVLEAALRSKLASDYPNLELVVIDDRSRDRTGAIIDALAAEHPQLRPVHVTQLPAGWLGKLHALARGVEVASGEWLLFTDADTHFAIDALSRAVGYAERRQLDFLALIPDLLPSGVVIDAALGHAAHACAGRAQARHRRSSLARGGGRWGLQPRGRSALERTAGFEALKMEVIDDVALAQMIKAAGGRCSVAHGHGLVALHFYRTLGEMARGGEKNSYAALGHFRLWQLLGLVALFLVVEWGPFWVQAMGGALRTAGFALLALDLVGAVGLALWLRRPWLSGLLTPLGVTLVMGIALRSAYLATLHGGIAWRETFYALTELRKGRRVRLL